MRMFFIVAVAMASFVASSAYADEREIHRAQIESQRLNEKPCIYAGKPYSHGAKIIVPGDTQPRFCWTRIPPSTPANKIMSPQDLPKWRPVDTEGLH